MHNCFILQYVYYDPLHVSSISLNTCQNHCHRVKTQLQLNKYYYYYYYYYYMLIIRTLNCIDAASGIVTLNKFAVRCTGQPLTESDDTKCCINTIQPPDDEHIMLETCIGS